MKLNGLKKWSNFKNYSLSTLGSFFDSKKKKISNIQIEDIQLYLNNPIKYQSEILDVSDTLYAPEGIYKTMVNLLVNMATLDNYVQPNGFTVRKLKQELINKENEDEKQKVLDGFEKEYDIVKQYINDINIKKTTRRQIENLVKYGVYCGFEKNDGYKPYMWDLPLKYVRLYSIVNGEYKIQFNFKYFEHLARDRELLNYEWDRYPIEFHNLYERYKKNPDKVKHPEWQVLPHDKVCCIKLGGDNDLYFLPMFSQLFTELFKINETIDNTLENAEDERIKLVHQKLPTDDQGEPLIDPTPAQEWHKVVAKSLPESVSLATSPYALTEIPFKSTQNQKTELVNFTRDMAYLQSGVNPLITGGTATNSSIGISQNLIYNQSLIFSVLDKIESWYNYRVHNITKKKYTFKLHILKTTWFNLKETWDREYKLVSIGYPMTTMSAISGYNSDDVEALLYYENLTNVKNKLKPPQNMNQMSSNSEVGATEKSLEDLDDNGIKTRDNETNNR